MSETAESQKRRTAFQGRSAGAGIAYGPVFFHLEGIADVEALPISEADVPQELARLDSVARAARVSLVHQRDELSEHFTDEQKRIFDAHLRMLEDPVLEADVRGRISEQRMSLEGAVKDALGVYERLFAVVESNALRTKLGDLRDVTLRILRHCNRARIPRSKEDRAGAVLVVAELSVSDLTEALEQRVAAIVAEGGTLASHGAILTRAAGIPAVIGVGGIHDSLAPGDMVLVDGETGEVVLNPNAEEVGEAEGRKPDGVFEAMAPATLADGSAFDLQAAVASPSEARRAASLGITRVGLYRTELPVLQRQGEPREEPLAVLYGQVVKVADQVAFRLPDLDASTNLHPVFPHAERNPALGLRGIRLLLSKPEMLETQIRAMLRACGDQPLSLVVPFVEDLDDLGKVREVIQAQREALRLEGEGCPAVRLGVSIETPAGALLAREILAEVDFALIGVDSLAMSLLTADRSSPYEAVRQRLASPHPVVLRAVRKLIQVADGLRTPLTVYGEAAVRMPILGLLVGAGIRALSVPPDRLREVHASLAGLDPEICQNAAEAACHSGNAKTLAAGLPSQWGKETAESESS